MGTALVTGATAGIGAEFARQLAARGDDVVLVARDEVRLEATAAELRRTRGIATEVVVADLSDRAAVDRVAARLADPGRPVDTLVNNAGFGLRGRFVGSDVETEQTMIDVMVTATMRLTHAAVGGMVDRGHGEVVNVSSVAAWVTGGTYSAAKAWETVFSESLARELAGTGVQVTALAPGYTHTEFHARAGIDMSGISERLWLDAGDVVATALADVRRGRAVSVPGAQYKVFSTLARYAPRPLVRRVTGGPARSGLRRKD